MNRKELKKELYLYDTHVENFFIGEHLPSAPGDAVKVYLYALMYTDIDRAIRRSELAKALGISPETVDDAWAYWEQRNVIRRIYPDPADRSVYDIEFRRLKELIYGAKGGKMPAAEDVSADEGPAVPNPLADETIRAMFASVEEITGEPVADPTAIYGWIGKYGATPETIVEAFRYAAVSRKKTRVSYVEKIVEEWAGKGLLTADAIREHLEAHDERHALYRRVLRALGLYRNATEEEERLMDAWFDDYGFPITRVLEACKKTAGIANPNIKYINTVLRGWYRDEHGTDPASKEGPLTDPADPSRVTAAYVRKRMAEYAALREKEEADAERRREAVYTKFPRVRAIEEEIHTLSMRMSRLALGGTGLGAAAAMRDRLAALEREKQEILAEAGLTPADLAIRYTCEKCRDTGYLDDGSRCECFVR